MSDHYEDYIKRLAFERQASKVRKAMEKETAFNMGVTWATKATWDDLEAVAADGDQTTPPELPAFSTRAERQAFVDGAKQIYDRVVEQEEYFAAVMKAEEGK